MARNANGIGSDDVLKAACRAFAEKGYRGTNLNDVATELNVTRQAIYHYYPSKHDILKDLFERFFTDLDDRVSRAVAEVVSPADAFEAMLSAHVIYVSGVPDLAAIFMREYVSLTDEARDAIRHKRRNYHQRFVAAFRAAQKEGVYREADANAAVSVLLGAVNWLFRWYRPERGGSLETEELARFCIGLLAHGYRAHPPSSPPKQPPGRADPVLTSASDPLADFGDHVARADLADPRNR
jgi:TetR/AcrR family transcriptional regulator, cholesterol catabolism regulator